MKIRGVLFGGLAAALLSGCQVMDDSKAMRRTLEDLQRKGDHIAERADGLERKMKFKESTAMFAFAMEMLFGENGKSGQETPEGDKNVETEMTLYAETGIRSLLFQFWNGDFKEYTIESLDQDFDISVAMVFTRLKGYIPKNFSVDVLMPDRKFKGIGSFAARMEQMQPEYLASLEKRGLPRNLSLYEVIAQALEARNELKQTGLLAKTKAKILHWNGEAIYLLQMRHNYLPMLVLSRMTDLSDRGDLARIVMALRGQAIDLSSSDPTKQITNEKLREWTYWLNEALETRARLKNMGIQPEYNKTLGTLLRAPDFGQKKLLAIRANEIVDERQRLEVEFARAYNKIVKDMPSMLAPKGSSQPMPIFGKIPREKLL